LAQNICYYSTSACSACSCPTTFSLSARSNWQAVELLFSVSRTPVSPFSAGFPQHASSSLLWADCIAVTITAPSTTNAQIKRDAFITYVSELLPDFLSSRSLLTHSRLYRPRSFILL